MRWHDGTRHLLRVEEGNTGGNLGAPAMEYSPQPELLDRLQLRRQLVEKDVVKVACNHDNNYQIPYHPITCEKIKLQTIYSKNLFIS